MKLNKKSSIHKFFFFINITQVEKFTKEKVTIYLLQNNVINKFSKRIRQANIYHFTAKEIDPINYSL